MKDNSRPFLQTIELVPLPSAKRSNEFPLFQEYYVANSSWFGGKLCSERFL